MKCWYLIATQTYYLLIQIVALWNNKAKKWSSGRKDIFVHIQTALQTNQKPIIWIHAASAGELEQARPLMQTLKKKYPQYAIFLTIFSPSGYNTNTEADYIFYLPKDTPKNAIQLLEILRPTMVFFIKYEFWYFLLKAIKAQQIPLFLVSGIFRKNQLFFKSYAKFFQAILKCFTHFFVQDIQSQTLLKNIALHNVSVFGDTRFDIVNHMLQQPQKDFHNILSIINHRKVLIAGSTWKKDHQLLSKLALQYPDLFLIIVPHEVAPKNILKTLSYFNNPIQYSQIQKHKGTISTQVLVVDQIGILSRLYRLATITYIGGGFTHSGIHNVLEPAVYSKPVIWGKNYKKYIEAKKLIQAHGGFAIHTQQELQQIVKRLLENTSFYQKTCLSSYHFVQQNIGATQRIIQYLQQHHFLPPSYNYADQ